MRLKVRAIKNRARNKILEILVKTMVSLAQTEKGEWGPKSMGQNGAETHLGTIRVPIDLHTTKCLMTRGTRDTGGTSQLFSPAQSKQKASTPSESGFQKREKNLVNFRLWELAKRSTECGPQMFSTRRKNLNETHQRSY